MFWVFKKIRERLTALFIADAALDLEAEFLDRHAERKAELLRKAQEYEEEQGLEDLAEEVRVQAMSLSAEKPLASMLPAINGLAGDANETETPRLEGSANEPKHPARNGSTSKSRKVKKSRKTKAR